MDKENVIYIHTHHIYTHTHHGILVSYKKNKIMSFAAIWMELEVIILKEVMQEWKTKYCMFFIISGS